MAHLALSWLAMVLLGCEFRRMKRERGACEALSGNALVQNIIPRLPPQLSAASKGSIATALVVLPVHSGEAQGAGRRAWAFEP